MKISKVICAEDIIRDIDGGKVVIHNLYDDINVNLFPILLNKFSVYFLCHKEDSESDDNFNSCIKIFNNEKLLFQDTIKINFRNKNITRGVIKFNGLVIPTDGILKIQFFDKNDKLLNDTIVYLSLNKSQRISVKVSK